MYHGTLTLQLDKIIRCSTIKCSDSGGRRQHEKLKIDIAQRPNTMSQCNMYSNIKFWGLLQVWKFTLKTICNLQGLTQIMAIEGDIHSYHLTFFK